MAWGWRTATAAPDAAMVARSNPRHVVETDIQQGVPVIFRTTEVADR